ncbi:MAG: ABC transporter permease, partial [Patescibacteria group bacterium]
MKIAKLKIEKYAISLRVGFFLALRQVRRSSKYTNGLIIFVMVLTFLNLVVVRGILVGLLEGSTEAYRSKYAGDVLITNLPKKNFIENSPNIISVIQNMPWVESYSYRYVEGGEVEANYKSKIRMDEDSNSTAGSIVGINPELEDAFSGMSLKLVEGRYMNKNDAEGILIGANLLRKYLDIEAPGLTLLEDVEVGDRVRLTVGGNRREFTVLGFLQSKVDQIDFRIFVLDTTLRNMIGRSDY